ncbi:hypothetical protein [Streptomyces sp. NPDC004296]|uniref:hypothetical protein n=1 Tax=Streptomyces sp. NPDC004296 TaxID=3364697 RepID=UPI0036C583ED
MSDNFQGTPDFSAPVEMGVGTFQAHTSGFVLGNAWVVNSSDGSYIRITGIVHGTAKKANATALTPYYNIAGGRWYRMKTEQSFTLPVARGEVVSLSTHGITDGTPRASYSFHFIGFGPSGVSLTSTSPELVETSDDEPCAQVIEGT